MFMRAARPVMACLIAMIVGSAGGSAAQPAAPEAGTEEKGACPPVNADRLFAGVIEKACLPLLEGVAIRADDVLRILLRNGTTKAFKDSPSSCREARGPNTCFFHALSGYYPENDAVVVERRLDGPTQFLLGAYMVERATGRVIDLPTAPRFAPDRSRFVSMSVCADHCANRVDIWSIQDGVAKLEWRYRLKQQGEKTFAFQFVEWQGNEEIKLYILPEVSAEGDAGKA